MSTTPAGFWIRFAALIIDTIIVGMFQTALGGGLALIGSFVFGPASEDNMGGAMAAMAGWSVAVACSYFYYMWFYKHKGASLGKLACDLQVVDYETKGRCSYGKTLLRESIGRLVSAAVLCIGYLMVVFRDDKRALHDLIAGTQVVRIVKNAG